MGSLKGKAHVFSKERDMYSLDTKEEVKVTYKCSHIQTASTNDSLNLDHSELSLG